MWQPAFPGGARKADGMFPPGDGVEAIPQVIARTVEVEACADLLMQAVGQLAPTIILVTALCCFALVLLCWPRRQQVTMVLVQDETGRLVDVQTVSSTQGSTRVRAAIAANARTAPHTDDAPGQ